LVDHARTAAKAAYAPYSNFSVGAAVEAIDGRIVTGSNMENACYRLGVCAEIAALTLAQQQFGLANIARIAVAGGRLDPGAGLAGSELVTPCGGCRQSILEAAHVAGRDIEIVCASGDGKTVTSMRISDLLPLGFGPATIA
jgi:cytidine deaminase